MALNFSLSDEDSIPRTLFKILKLEAGQGSLPESRELLLGSLGAYALGEALAQGMAHSVIGAILYGVVTTATLAGSTYGILRFRGETARFVKTLTALAAAGALAGVVYTLLHMLFAMALPDPLPTQRLLQFLLFPVIVWNVFMFAFLYRNTKIRPIPAFAIATFFVIFIDLLLSPLLK